MHRLLLLLPLLALAAGCGFGSRGKATETSAQNRIVVQLGEGANGGFFAARAKGYYENAGIHVMLQAGGADLDTVDSVLHGDADVGAGAPTPVHAAVKRGADVEIVGTAGKIVFARHEWLDVAANEDAAHRFVQASARGWEFCKSHRGASECRS
jgi:ABC-type nitrate/sulfonate/bicarbonate transport system substrate-binding protein